MQTTPPTPIRTRAGFVSRFFRWLFSWRTIRRALIALAGLVTFAALLWTEENWRGKHAWETYKREWEAKGERFDLASFVPKPVPPEQNFAATPFLAPLLDYQIVNSDVHWGDSNGVARAKSVAIGDVSLGSLQRGEFCDLQAAQKLFRSDTNFPANSPPQDPAHDVLFALQKYGPILAELRAASRRPYAVYSIHPDEDFAARAEQFSVLKSLTRVTTLRALANLEAGSNEQALADVKLAFHLGQSLRSEPLVISQLVRISMLTLSLQPVWEGLARHRWAAAQLDELQKLLASISLLEDYGFMMRGERAFNNEGMAQYRAGRFGQEQKPAWLMPRGLFYQNQLVINRLHQQITLPAVDAAAHRVYPEKCETNAVASILKRPTPYNFIARMLFPAYQHCPERFARAQTSLDEAAVACALERYRLADGRLPDTLDALVPGFLDKLPNDVIDGQPLRYRPTTDGSYVVYSIGWNKTDDGGKLGWTSARKPAVDPGKGDWVWQVPAKGT